MEVQMAGGAPGVLSNMAEMEPPKMPALYMPSSMGMPISGST